MSDDVLVRVDSVSKRFCRSLKRSLWYGLLDLGSELGGRRHGGGYGLPQNSADVELRKDEFWAVKDVSFELRRGECLGLIGHNGAGKTTLLKMLNGLIKPDAGAINMRGRVGALIALGAGFNPILTGRENIYVNASVLGLSKKEITDKIDEIIDFAEIGEFIDMPLQNYSSGMTVRLGFAAATSLAPDVLILDEVLGGGDAKFRAKCYDKVSSMMNRSAVIFVSHSMEYISQICTSSLLINKGLTESHGRVEEVIQAYQRISIVKEDGFLQLDEDIYEFQCELDEYSIHFAQNALLRLNFSSSIAIDDCILRVAIYDPNGVVVGEWNSRRARKRFDLRTGNNNIEVSLNRLMLKTGRYTLGIVLNKSDGISLLVWSLKGISLNMLGPIEGGSAYQLI